MIAELFQQRLTDAARAAGRSAVSSLRTGDAELWTFKPYLHIRNVPDEHVIYIVSPEDLSPKYAVPLTILVAGIPEPETRRQIETAFPLANLFYVSRLGSDANLDSFFGMVSNLFLEENRYISAIARLTAASNSDRGLAFLVSEASEILRSPIIVNDLSYRILAASVSRGDAVDELETQYDAELLSQSNVERMHRDHIMERLRASADGMYCSLASDAAHAWMNILVSVHGIEAAEIGIQEKDHPFTWYDKELMKFFRQLLVLEFQKGQYTIHAQGLAHGVFLNEPLNDGYISPTLIRQRMQLLDWKDSDWWCLLMVYSDGTGRNTEQVRRRRQEMIASRLSSRFPGSHYCHAEEHLMLLIPLASPDLTPYRTDDRIGEFLKSSHCLAVFSNPFPDLTMTPRFYKQTLSVRSLADYYSGDKALLFYSDFALLRMALEVRSTIDLKEFYDPVILLIRDYDGQNHTTFLETLRAYLDHIDNPTAVARTLHIHKNTLYYRINKLKDLFPIDLNDGRQRLRMQFTMELMKLED